MKKIHRYGMYFKRIHLDIEKEIHTKLSAYNLTKSQLDILNYLDQHPDQMTCQKDLQNYLHVSNATIIWNKTAISIASPIAKINEWFPFIRPRKPTKSKIFFSQRYTIWNKR